MEKLITTIVCTFRLFKQPRKIGDTFKPNDIGDPVLVIGIEKYELRGERLIVWYTCQRLNHEAPKHSNYKRPTYNAVEGEVKAKYDEPDLEKYQPGKTVWIREQLYKIQEYTEIALKGTDLVISFMARPIYPVSQKEVKEKLFGERRKKLKVL
ncbi:hypothetical protein C5G87_06840 [Paenibacillus peoriae]|uniref:hypothetical protein n=1 Tax=Paenibacillus peoriae TaxID=59893 RepID=UPI000CEC81D9|nr:hypothetical protein [Paenibacillus peoriae]PPQ49086.1 hypothetical protein C5G87_06840 [Paenibacillus peoriae]